MSLLSGSTVLAGGTISANVAGADGGGVSVKVRAFLRCCLRWLTHGLAQD